MIINRSRINNRFQCRFGSIQLVLAIIIANLYFPKIVIASRELIITSDKTSLFANEEMQVNASISGFATDEAIFIKGAFFQNESSNYFGLTKFGDSWIKNSVSTIDQRQVKIGEWNNILIVKSDFTDSGFKGNGDYKFKIGFYYTTTGGNLSSVNWSDNNLTVALVAPSPAPNVSPAPTKSPAPAILKTTSPTITLIATKHIISTPQITPRAIPTLVQKEDKIPETNVLRIENTPNASQYNVDSTKSDEANKNFNFTAILIIGLGVIFIATSFYMAYQTSKNDHNLK